MRQKCNTGIAASGKTTTSNHFLYQFEEPQMRIQTTMENIKGVAECLLYFPLR